MYVINKKTINYLRGIALVKKIVVNNLYTVSSVGTKH